MVSNDHLEHPSPGMRLKRVAYCLLIFSTLAIAWKLSVIASAIDHFQALKPALNLCKHQLQLRQLELQVWQNLARRKLLKSQPTIYAITPTYWRHVQKAELTRISQTLQLAPHIFHWILVEDSANKSDLVRNLIVESNLVVTHLNAKTPPDQRRHRGLEQRNAALKWLRDNLTPQDHGIVYFMDDDNTYNVKVFSEIAKIKNVGVWPVGLVAGLNAETPILDKVTGRVKGYKSGWRPNRPFAIDMAGFAINLQLILAKPEAVFSSKVERGFQETEFLTYFTTREELEPLADNCTKVYVWHTRAAEPVVVGIVPGLEV